MSLVLQLLSPNICSLNCQVLTDHGASHVLANVMRPAQLYDSLNDIAHAVKHKHIPNTRNFHIIYLRGKLFKYELGNKRVHTLAR